MFQWRTQSEQAASPARSYRDTVMTLSDPVMPNLSRLAYPFVVACRRKCTAPFISYVWQPRQGRPTIAQGAAQDAAGGPASPGITIDNTGRSSPSPSNTPARRRDRNKPRHVSRHVHNSRCDPRRDAASNGRRSVGDVLARPSHVVWLLTQGGVGGFATPLALGYYPSPPRGLLLPIKLQSRDHAECPGGERAGLTVLDRIGNAERPLAQGAHAVVIAE